MKKRIISLLLSLVMLIGMFPAASIAAELQPEQQPLPCAACGVPGCTTAHVYCEICSAYDCGVDHSVMPAAEVQPEQQPLPCAVCGVPGCTAEHVYCETCSAYDCGLSHEPAQPTEGDSDDAAQPTEGSGETGDSADPSPTPTAQPTQQPTESSPAPEADTPDYAADIGKLARLNADCSAEYITGFDGAQMLYFERASFAEGLVLTLEDWHVDTATNTLWYSFSACEGSLPEAVPENCWLLQNTIGSEAPDAFEFITIENDDADSTDTADSVPALCTVCGLEPCICPPADDADTADDAESADVTGTQPEVCTRCGAEPCICVPMTSTGPKTTSTPDYSANVGKYAQFDSYWQSIELSSDPSLSGNRDFCNISVIPDGIIVHIIGCYVSSEDNSVWYKVEAADGYELSAVLVASPWVFQNYVNGSDIDTLYFVDFQPENPCGCCEACTGKEGCTCECEACTFKPKELCPVCGAENCAAVHFWCDICKKYDCGIAHALCLACGDVDCTKEHVFCPVCGSYDCGISHEDKYAPPAAPVIPENPVMTPGADISLTDETGAPISSAGLALEKGKKLSLSAWSLAGDSLGYQWQVCYDPANDLWADIQGETGKGILLSPAMFRNIISCQGSTALRCVSADEEHSYASPAVPIVVTEAVPEMSLMSAAPRFTSAAPAAVPAAEGDGVSYSIIIEYRFENGSTAAQAWTASLNAGQSYVLDVECPAVLGYKPDRERITETISNISGNRSYVVTYTPDYVDYKVEYYQQALTGSSYSHVDTVTHTGLTGSQVGTGLNPENKYPGFYALDYDTSLVVAADGSTIVKVYYDRDYFMLSLNLNGGYGAEPVFARYGTPVNSAAFVPERTGYTFAGWEPALPGLITAHTSHTAQWDKAGTQFSVAFWYENANDEEYTFVGSAESSKTTGSIVNGEDYRDLAFDGRDDEHFTYEKADSNVVINADGTTVVNVYFTRNSYTLTYLAPICFHVENNQHNSDCCSLPVHNHSSGCSCSVTAHQHSRSCLNNFRNNPDSVVRNELNNAYPNPENGFYCNHKTFIGTNRYYVYLGGSWYRIDDSTPSYNCGYSQHAHSASCCTLPPHNHTCNTSACSHQAKINAKDPAACGCAHNFDSAWRVYTSEKGVYGSKKFKYQQDVSEFHASMDAHRWCPGACEGLKDKDGNYYASYGASPAHGVYSSMGGGDVVFYQGTTGPCQYYLTFWLETYDGSGSRNYNGRNFAQGTTFTPKMGAVGYQGDYKPGIPVGFAEFEAWASDSQGGSNLAQLTSPNGSFSGNTYNFYNFYYIRQSFTLTYFNGSNTVATRTMKYDEPLSSAYNLQNLSMVSPYGPGYEFAGWYLDPQCSVRENFNGTSRMPDGGMALYAKWAPTTHTVRAYIDSNSMTGTPFYQSTALHGGTVAVPPNEPTNGVMNFVGWFYLDENGNEVAYDFSMPVYRDMELYAVWNSSTIVSGTISYMIKGTNTKIAADSPANGFVGATKTYDAKIGGELFSGYQTGYFPVTSSHNIQFSANQGYNNYVFYYVEMPEVRYTVRYLEKDTNKVLAEPTTGTSKDGRITVTHKTIKGYAADAFSKDLILSSDASLNVITFWYTEDTVHAPVQVSHYIQNTDGTGYIHYFTEPAYNGTIGQVQTASPLTISGFTYNKSNNSINGVTLGAEGLQLTLYYDRNTYPYEFRFVSKATGAALAQPVSGSGLFGASVTQSALSIPGYKLESGASGSMSVTIAVEDPANTVNKNLRTFYYVEDTVTISYAVGAVKGGSVSPAAETVMAVTGTPTGSTASVDDDYNFIGWFADYSLKNKLSDAAHFVPGKSDGVYVKATYYAGFEEKKVTLNYAVVAPAGASPASLSTTSEQVSLRTGYAAGSTVTVNDARYEFVGWYNNADCTGNALSTNASYTPVKNYDAKWVDKTTYYAKVIEKKAEIRYQAVGGFGSVSPAYESVDMVTGTASGSTAEAAEKIGKFVGWYDNADCSGTPLSTTASFVPAIPTGGWPADGSTYYAKFEGIEYTITFENSADAQANIPPVHYACGDELELPELTNGSYVVNWTVKETDGDWTVGNRVTDGQLIENYGNVTLVANWTVSVIWIDWDVKLTDLIKPGVNVEEIVLEIDEDVPYGQTHSYNGEAPTREDDDKYSYTFDPDGWKVEDLSAYQQMLPEGHIIYRASYEETEKTATLSYKAEANGKVRLNVSQTGDDGQPLPPQWSAEASEEVTKVTGTALGAVAQADAGYEFIGWYDKDGNKVSDDAAFVPAKAADALWTDTEYTAKFKLALVQLTIVTTCADANQNFVFELTRQNDDTAFGTFSQRIVLVGNDSKTLKDIPVGTYIITELGSWSWRHNENHNSSVVVDTDKSVQFDFGAAENNKWLSGCSTY